MTLGQAKHATSLENNISHNPNPRPIENNNVSCLLCAICVIRGVRGAQGCASRWKNYRPKFRLAAGQIWASPPAVLCNTSRRIIQTASQHVQEKARDAPLIRLQSKPHTQDVYSRSHHRIPRPDHHRIQAAQQEQSKLCAPATLEQPEPR